MAVVDRLELRRSLDDVEDAGIGQLAEDGRQQWPEAGVLDRRLLDGVTRRGAPKVFRGTEARPSRLPIRRTSSASRRISWLPPQVRLYGRNFFTF
jgi:hypothetical protein